MTVDLPADASPKVREAVAELLNRAHTRFTGSLLVDFKDGIPLAVKVTECRRLGKQVGIPAP